MVEGRFRGSAVDGLPDGRLLDGRAALVSGLVERAVAAYPPLSVLTGEAGAGRSAVVDALARALTVRDVPALSLRLGESDRHVPYGALYRLLLRLDHAAGSRQMSVAGTVLGLVTKLAAVTPPGGGADESTSARLAEAVFSALRQSRGGPEVLLVDDAQFLDSATARVVEPLARLCARSGSSIIATWRLGGTGPRPPVGRMRHLLAEGLAWTFPLRPLTRDETSSLIAEEVAAVPDSVLVDRFHRITRGNLSALRAAVDSARGALRVVDQHAYLDEGADPPSLSADHPLLTWLRGGGRLRWRVAGAMAVLCSVGAGVPGLVAEALDVDADAVVAEVGALVSDRVLVRDPREGWRFRMPLLRDGLQSCLGPYERRRFCALGVAALREGRVRSDDEYLLADLLAGAGGLVDQHRSAAELLASGWKEMFTDPARAVRWLRAAARRTVDPADRANVVVVLAACAVGDWVDEVVESSRSLLQHHSAELDPGSLQEVEVVHTAALAAAEQWDELEWIAAGNGPLWTGRDQGIEVITQGFALLLLGRWGEGQRLLQKQCPMWSAANPVTADFGYLFLSGAGVVLGDLSTLRRFAAQPRLWPAGDLPQHSFEHTRCEVESLLMLGELRPALELLEARSVGVEQLQGSARFLVEWLGGQHSAALDTARRSIVSRASATRPETRVMMYFGAARLLASKGWVSRARRMVEFGRGRHLVHVLDHVDFALLRFLGADEDADELLRRGLHRAEEQGHVLGTEHMWGDMARRERELGAPERARECVRRTEELARRLATGHAELVHLLARAEVLDDATAAGAAVELARERAIPYETATTLRRVALSGVDTSALLLESYELFGELDALLWRGHMRVSMRAHGVTVPGRRVTTRENERLLAVLVSEGLTNRQLAIVFGASEKSVEGRLTRMFAKVGYRSRVELAAALLRGEHPV